MDISERHGYIRVFLSELIFWHGYYHGDCMDTSTRGSMLPMGDPRECTWFFKQTIHKCFHASTDKFRILVDLQTSRISMGEHGYP